ncbi:A24 family peptidase [Desulfovibrio subterraneus]|uniref:Type 4 prepilin peptidase 1 n=1 Tax=Desulfovibrio subterraneus TaxID=2718620 RepID=A0A7J0BG04_9BACT|nr:A24 family peptidase [Desulfovibrio subterraneus]GFM32132.1 type 4 prepilin peptidase 1 [Desulfovibrio subterraneus]
MQAYLNLLLAAVLLIATVTDLKGQRIPNWLTFPAMAFALAFHGITQGLDGLAFSLSGLTLGFGVMILPYLFGAMGAGDVKLMMAAGAFLGFSLTLQAFLLTSLAGGLYAIIMLARHMDVLKKVFAALRDTAVLFFVTRQFAYVRQADDKRFPRLCYGVAIAAGTLGAMVITWGPAGFIPAQWM